MQVNNENDRMQVFNELRCIGLLFSLKKPRLGPATIVCLCDASKKNIETPRKILLRPKTMSSCESSLLETGDDNR